MQILCCEDILSRSFSDPLVTPAWSGWLGKLWPVKADYCVQFSLKIFLSQLRATVHLHLLLQGDVEGLLYHVHHRIPAAGVHHPLLDRHGVSRHGVNKNCKMYSCNSRNSTPHSPLLSL